MKHGPRALTAIALFVAGCGTTFDEADDDGVSGEESGSTADALLAGRQLTEREVATMIRAAGFPESYVGRMVCTAKYESRYYERATNRNRNGTTDRGLFQVNSVHVGGTAGCPSNGEALFNAATNTKCAYAIFRAQGMGAWYAYRAHRSECDRFPAPAGGAAPGVETAPVPGPAAPSTDPGDPGPSVVPAPSSTPAAPAGAGCYSPTLRTYVDELTCVQAASNRSYYQCHNGYWYLASASTGPYGTCSSVYPL